MTCLPCKGAQALGRTIAMFCIRACPNTLLSCFTKAQADLQPPSLQRMDKLKPDTSRLRTPKNGPRLCRVDTSDGRLLRSLLFSTGGAKVLDQRVEEVIAIGYFRSDSAKTTTYSCYA